MLIGLRRRGWALASMPPVIAQPARDHDVVSATATVLARPQMFGGGPTLLGASKADRMGSSECIRIGQPRRAATVVATAALAVVGALTRRMNVAHGNLLGDGFLTGTNILG